MDPAPPVPSRRLLLLGAALAIALLAVCIAVGSLSARVSELTERSAKADATLAEVLREVTRIRIEQRSEGQGINALMEKIAAYAPILTEANVTKPDYDAARREMDAVLRAVQSIGADAFAPLQGKLLKLDPQKDFILQKLLLDAALRADAERGKQLVVKLLQGFHRDVPTSAQMRWYAASKLIEVDKPLAQQVLRGILNYESHRGIDPERAPPGVTPGLAGNSTGFSNFVGLYLRSEDPQAEETLLMLLGRAGHDRVTIQECVKALGDMKSKQAAKPIEHLYHHPPEISDNPIFQVNCLEALASILGKEACPMFSEELKQSKHQLVTERLKLLMREIGC